MTARWKPGDTVAYKKHDSGYVYIGVEEAERLGITDGVDGWTFTVVVEDPPNPQ